MSVRIETQSQFWRESEQQWVDRVNIHRSEVAMFGGTRPKRWRHRTITIVTTTSQWKDGEFEKRDQSEHIG